jgi:general stress protein 26
VTARCRFEPGIAVHAKEIADLNKGGVGMKLENSIAALGEKVDALAKAAAEQNEPALPEPQKVFMALVGCFSQLPSIEDLEQRESLNKTLRSIALRLQTMGAPRRTPVLTAHSSKADIKARICEVMKNPEGAPLATIGEDGKPWVRYVVMAADPDLAIWINTSSSSIKVSQLRKHPEVQIAFKPSSPSEVEYRLILTTTPSPIENLRINGTARICHDLAERKARFQWFGWLYWKGPEDPEYTLAVVKPARIELYNLLTEKDPKAEQRVWVWEP